MDKSLVVLALFGWPLLAVAQESVDRRVDADADGLLEITNTAGEVVVEGWDRNEVQVTGTLAPNVERLDVIAEGGNVIVRVVLPNRGFGNRGYWPIDETRLRIRAPRDMSFDVDAVSADIDVREMRGEQRVETVSGDVDTEAFEAEVRVQTVSGDIRVEGRADALLLRVSTVSGDATIDNVSGDVSGESVSGDVMLRTGTVDRARVQTVSGEVLVTAELGRNARLEGSAVSGDLEFLFTGSGDADYRLETFSGEIDNCFGPELADADDDDRRGPPGRELRFREGNTQARVEATTHSGDIEICRQ